VDVSTSGRTVGIVHAPIQGVVESVTGRAAYTGAGFTYIPSGIQGTSRGTDGIGMQYTPVVFIARRTAFEGTVVVIETPGVLILSYLPVAVEIRGTHIGSGLYTLHPGTEEATFVRCGIGVEGCRT